jgi:hypothetical protein
MKCDLAGCVGGPTQLASGPASGTGNSSWGGLVVQGSNAYWADTLAGTLMGCPVAGCGGSPQLVASQMTAQNLAADATNLYWTANATVMKCGAAGCASPTALAAGQSDAYGIAIDAASVYWTNHTMPDYSAGYLTWGAVMKCDLGGFSGGPTTLALDLSDPYGIAVDATSVYWTDEGNGTVAKTPK